MDTPPLLVQVTNVTKRFGGTVALNEASFACRHGSIHALVGENGAGKSTLVKMLAGVVVPDSGQIDINGQLSTMQSPADAARLGIVPVFQELSLMTSLTVAENVFISNPPHNRLGLVNQRKLRQQSEALFADLGFSHVDPDALVSELPLAQRQLVEIAKALSRHPQILIMDEGTSALAVHDVSLVFAVMRRMRDEGRSVIFISHRMDEVKEIADHLTIFRDGRNLGSFVTGEVNEGQMVQLMIGHSLEEVFPPKPEITAPRQPLLEVINLSWDNRLNNINLSVGKGEIVGLGGLDGQGQGELLFALFGLLNGITGQICIEGKPRHINSPSVAAKAGINLALIPEDRKTEGLILKMSVGNNVTMATIDELSRFGLIDERRELTTIQRVIQQMQVKVSTLKAPVNTLSGGNQQKVVIGKWLLTQAKLYLLHDPSRGIDVGTKQEIYRLIRELADQGAGILYFSTELAELVGMCDRVLIFYEGKVIRELVGAEITQQAIVSAGMGLNATVVEPIEK
ncbi:MAG: sugar ABC transporter ATP-binding protein [Chloroflexota bacterium]